MKATKLVNIRLYLRKIKGFGALQRFDAFLTLHSVNNCVQGMFFSDELTALKHTQAICHEVFYNEIEFVILAQKEEVTYDI
jgi:hypothetical protein